MTAGRVILWWELRRLLYNAVLLVIGGATVVGYEWLMTKLIPLGEDSAILRLPWRTQPGVGDRNHP